MRALAHRLYERARMQPTTSESMRIVGARLERSCAIGFLDSGQSPARVANIESDLPNLKPLRVGCHNYDICGYLRIRFTNDINNYL